MVRRCNEKQRHRYITQALLVWKAWMPRLPPHVMQRKCIQTFCNRVPRRNLLNWLCTGYKRGSLCFVHDKFYYRRFEAHSALLNDNVFVVFFNLFISFRFALIWAYLACLQLCMLIALSEWKSPRNFGRMFYLFGLSDCNQSNNLIIQTVNSIVLVNLFKSVSFILEI